MQVFDSVSGNRTYLEHYQAGRRQDPASGAPAVQVFNAASGVLVAAERYAKGRHVAELSKQDLVEFSVKKGLPVALPESVRPFVRPELRPVL